MRLGLQQTAQSGWSVIARSQDFDDCDVPLTALFLMSCDIGEKSQRCLTHLLHTISATRFDLIEFFSFPEPLCGITYDYLPPHTDAKGVNPL